MCSEQQKGTAFKTCSDSCSCLQYKDVHEQLLCMSNLTAKFF